MKAARFHEVGKELKVEDVEVPKIGSNDVLLRIRACGNCHTDLHFIDGILKPAKVPMILGHEMAGEVSEIGSSVKSFSRGDRVVFYYLCPCGECYFCKTGQENLCPNQNLAGFTDDGGYAEYIRAPGRNLVRLPKEISYEEAAPLACGGGTSYHAVRLAGTRLGDVAVAYGVGGLGLYAVQIAKLNGARVIAVDISDDKLETAKKHGADECINAKEKNLPAEVKKLTDNMGADAVFDFVTIEKSGADALQCLKRGGKHISIGASSERYRVDPVQILQSEFKICGSCGYTQQELVELVELVRKGKVKSMISKTLPLSRVNEALNDIRNRTVQGRAVTVP